MWLFAKVLQAAGFTYVGYALYSGIARDDMWNELYMTLAGMAVFAAGGALGPKDSRSMARRDTTPQDDEKRSDGALWLVLSVLLFIGALWAIADDNFFRRPWKKWQAGFNRLEISRIEDQIAAEQARLDADPKYQEVMKQLQAARAEESSGDTAKEIARLERELNTAVLQDQSKDLNLRFIKSELEELRFRYDDARDHGRPTEDILQRIQQQEQVRDERQ